VVGSKTPETSEGLEVKPLTRKELEEEIRKMEAVMGEAYASMLISAYQLNSAITKLMSMEEGLQLYLKPEDIDNLYKELERIEGKLEEVSRDLITLARDLVRKLAIKDK
jgi:hypothetical protein